MSMTDGTEKMNNGRRSDIGEGAGDMIHEIHIQRQHNIMAFNGRLEI